MAIPSETLSLVPVPRVAVVHCPDYDPARVDEAVARGIKLLGGIRLFFRPGEHILLKPNLLAAAAPEKVVTTHPAVFRAVAKILLDLGVKLSYGDSPGFNRPEIVARKAGLMDVAQELGIPMADFSSGESVSFPEGRFLKQFTIAKGVRAADGVVSLSKLKTHALTRVTGAVKNQFGCIPGLLKGEFHARMCESDRFPRMLVDLTRLIMPRLYIMDAVIAMEGNGPRNGDPKQLGALLFSTDAVALDAAACKLIALDPAAVPTNKLGQEMGLGRYDSIRYLGDPIEELIATSFRVNRKPDVAKGAMNRVLAGVLRKRLIPRPVIAPALCTRCGTCVKVCPATPKAVEFRRGKQMPPAYDYDVCIRCYCCQELCPEKAITVHTPLLGRLVHGRG